MIAKAFIKTLVILILVVGQSALAVWSLEYPPVFLCLLATYGFVALFFFIWADIQEGES